MNALAAHGHTPQSIAALEAALPSIAIDDLIKRIMLLAAVNVVRPTLPLEEQKIAAPRCAALNAYILSLPNESGAVLASPVLGAGVRVTALEKAFIAAYATGRQSIEALAEALQGNSDLRGRNARDVDAQMHADHLPVFRAMGLI